MSKDATLKKASQQEVRIYRLGQEPRDDLLGVTSAEERLEILRDLSERAWALGGRSPGTYERSEIPVRVTRLR